MAQSIRGVITDENGAPVPYANIYIEELKTGASADGTGHYFLNIDPGFYNVVVSSVGYDTKRLQVIVRDKTIVENITLHSSSVQLQDVVVRARRRDPAYDIIQKVITNKDKYLSQLQSFRTDVYLRATEILDKKQKEEKPEDLDDLKGPPPMDQAAEKQEGDDFKKLNMVEMQLQLNFQFPDHYKEVRSAYKTYGDKTDLFIPVFSETDFNFYRNLVDLKGISSVPLISPVSRTAILSYKYRLDETLKENGRVVYKIEVTPRKKGDATAKGYIYINDSTWNINRLELSMHKGALKFFDDFTISQTYSEVGDNLWIPTIQGFDYETRAGGKLSKGKTILVYTNFQKDYPFPPRFFGNEVSVITKEAYDRDSAYWNKSRTQALSEEEKKAVHYRDSVDTAHKTKAYLDSIEAAYNKVKLGEVLYGWIGFRNDEKKSNIIFPSLLNSVGFEVVGGWRFGPNCRYVRMYDNGRILFTAASLNVGLKNSDWQAAGNLWLRYDPYHLGDIGIRGGRNFYSINSYDAYLNQLRISNYIVQNYGTLSFRRELLNGLYVNIDLNFADRQSIAGYDATSIINKVLSPGDPYLFQSYQSFITNTAIEYTPAQKFMSEPNRKVVLGSKYPTFKLTHQKGWDGLFGGDTDFDYVELSMEQNLLLGTLGNSRYTIAAGKFINTRDLRYLDLKRFRESDPYLYSDPLHSFQLLDTALSTTNLFLEGHYIHHFNGALINNIPLIKKLRIQTVGGAGFMWLNETGYRHEEAFAGIERIFKINVRRRLRIGVYGVAGKSTGEPPTADWRVSFDIIDTWKREWSY